jgi:hypothetical protein
MKRERQLLFFYSPFVRKFSPIFHDYRYISVTADRDRAFRAAALIEYLIQNVQRPAAVNHEILGDNFKPVDDGFTREDMLLVRSAQANPNLVISKPIKATFRHILFAL